VRVPISDEVLTAMIVEHEKHLDRLVDLYGEMKARDAADGTDADEPSLGGITMAAQMMPDEMLHLLFSLAVRRLAQASR